MKRAFALALSAVLAGGLVGCASSESESGAASGSSSGATSASGTSNYNINRNDNVSGSVSGSTSDNYNRNDNTSTSGSVSGSRQKVRVRAEEQIDSDGRESYLRGEIREQDGALIARLAGHQGSGNLHSLVQANALLIIPAGVKCVPAGQEIQAWIL